jgi:DNA polymerase-3 subunit beta
MRISVLQENLAKGLKMVMRAVDPRPTLPVLANVLLVAEEARLKLVATNLERTITVYIGAKVDQEGTITLPAKTFSELVNNLSPERVDLTLQPSIQTVNVRCGTTNSNIKGITATEFPMTPEVTGAYVEIAGSEFKRLVKSTVYAAAREDNRPILTGVYIKIDGDDVTFAGADGYRLAVNTAKLENLSGVAIEVVIPAQSLVELANVEDDDTIGITLPGDRDLVSIASKSITVVSQLLEGRFPDFGAIIPKTYSTATTVYTADLLRACKRAEIFARDSANSARFRVSPPTGPGEQGEVMVTGKSAERGDLEGLLDAVVEGDPLEAAFNIRYLIDTLSILPDERVVLESNGASHPGVLRPEGRGDSLHIVMPMSVTR